MSKYDFLDVGKLMDTYDNETIHEMITNGELTKEAIETFNNATRLGDYRMKGFIPYEQPIAVDIPKDVSELTDTTNEALSDDVNKNPDNGEVTGGYDNYEEAGFDSYSDYAGASMAEGMGGTYDSDTGTISFEYDPDFESPFMEETEILDDDVSDSSGNNSDSINYDKLTLNEERQQKSSGNVVFSMPETETLEQKMKKLSSERGSILSIVANLYTKFELLNADTKTELETRYTISNYDLRNYLINSVNNWFDTLDQHITTVQNIMNATEGTNANSSGDTEGKEIESITSSGGGSSHSGGSSSSSSSSSNVSDIQTGPANTNVSLLASLVGTITFTEIIPLYKEIGGISNISATLNSNYGLIGIVQKDGKYYYKLLDTKTNETYYTEINDKIKIETNFTELAEIKEPAMMLNSTEIGTNNFVKLADQGTLFFVQDKLENNGLAFLDVLDSTDGKSYYIPQGDEVGLVSLESITSNIIGSE